MSFAARKLNDRRTEAAVKRALRRKKKETPASLVRRYKATMQNQKS